MDAPEVTRTVAYGARSSQPDVAIVGEINPDLIFYGLPRELPEEREVLASGFAFTLGSSSAILAHNLSLLGSKVTLSARIGSDMIGEMCCRRLNEAGVDLSHVVRSTSGCSTGLTLILPLGTTRRILTYPGAMFEMGIEDLDLDHLALAKHFHLSSLFLHRKLSPDIPGLFKEMKRRGLTTSLDPNDDPEGNWDIGLEELLPNVDVLFCTEQELVQIAKKEHAAEEVSDRVSLLIVKRGVHGASAYSGGQRIDLESLSVHSTDSVGAGDSFNAGFLHQWVRQACLEICLAFGNLAGGLSVTRSGGIEAFSDSSHRLDFLDRHWQQNRLVP